MLEICLGNNVTTEADEICKDTVLYGDEPLTEAEEGQLHPDIKSSCKGIPYKRMRKPPISEDKMKQITDGEIIFLESNPSTGNCDLMVIYLN